MTMNKLEVKTAHRADLRLHMEASFLDGTVDDWGTEDHSVDVYLASVDNGEPSVAITYAGNRRNLLKVSYLAHVVPGFDWTAENPGEWWRIRQEHADACVERWAARNRMTAACGRFCAAAKGAGAAFDALGEACASTALAISGFGAVLAAMKTIPRRPKPSRRRTLRNARHAVNTSLRQLRTI